MAECGGSIGTQRFILGREPQQILSALDSRTRVTVRSDPINGNTNVWITGTRSQSYLDGFLLKAGEAYQFDDAGARVAIYGLCTGADEAILLVITEGR